MRGHKLGKTLRFNCQRLSPRQAIANAVKSPKIAVNNSKLTQNLPSHLLTFDYEVIPQVINLEFLGDSADTLIIAKSHWLSP